ncbi:hypothetical protein FISHEDRAFT_30478, partial [Fistulina hepatica ATCC 64428]
MPPGSPYESFVIPYSIRVDQFTQLQDVQRRPLLHLLTHTHSDHVTGLSSKSFGYDVICSPDAKEMLLRHEVHGERALHDMDMRACRTRTFAHLKVEPTLMPDGTTVHTGSRDLLEEASTGLVDLMKLYPSTVHFFINSWTWGYEDALKSIAHAFNARIHFDRYKLGIYQNVSDPFLKVIGTSKADSTRFHACERFDRCRAVAVPDSHPGEPFATTSFTGNRVVYVNFTNMNKDDWEEYKASVRRDIADGKKVDALLCPLSRHSSLPELLEFVKLFRPHHVEPNTLISKMNGLDWLCIRRM